MTWGLWLALGLLTGAIAQGYGDARSRARQGIVGDWVYSDPNRRSASGINAHPQAAQVTTVTVTDQGDNDDVTITIDSIDVTINTGTGLDAAGIGALLAAAINAEGLIRSHVIATFDTLTLTLTGTTPGLAFDVSIANDASTVLSAVTAVTAADEADPVPFGRAVVHQGFSSGESERLVATPYAALFTAQVIHVTPTFVDTAEFTISLYEIRGSERVFVASATSTSATSVAVVVDNMVTAVNAAMPANTVVATDGTTHLVLTAEVPGTEWDVVVHATKMGATAPTAAVTYPTGPDETTSLWRAWQGISLYSPRAEAPTLAGTASTGQYAANEGVHYATRGVVWVESAESPGPGDTVYVETAAGASQGRLYAASSATRVALPKGIARWERAGTVAADGIAAIRLEA